MNTPEQFDCPTINPVQPLRQQCGEEPAKETPLAAMLLQSRLVMVVGEVDQELAEDVISRLLLLDTKSHDPIKVIIASPGGHVDSGYAIYDVMRFIASPVISIGAGWVASIAVPILLGADKDKRFALPNTRFLLHQPSGGAGGQAADIRIEAREILKIRNRINALISRETGQPEDKVAKDSDRNFWMNAEEALEYKLISKIISHVDEIG
ncbi:MAG: ATP-dependent Clp protease proteolytic subunit [Candidatus Hydrogenedentes bacterium]|nr:ATP-dependent Clp protease proteolytic subunit [Candidatus Hydrogenedentota bacterium]